MHPAKPQIIVLITLLCVTVASDAQDLSNLKKEPIISITGTLGAQLGAYDANGISNRRDPYSYLLSGNFNVKIKGWNIPVGFRFSQQENEFFQPFHHYGMSPEYKWIKVHAGYRRMKHSRYSLNNHIFLGLGTEIELPTLSGPVINISGMYGRLRRIVEPESVFLNGGESSFRRMGYAAKVKVASRKNQRNYVGIDLFHAKDDEESINSAFFDYRLEPKENLVFGFEGQINPLPSIHIKTTLGYSALTRNTTYREAGSLKGVLNPFSFLYSPNTSTHYSSAFHTKAEYNKNNLRIGLDYERIDPEYNSLGSYYFRNDIENISLQAGSYIRKLQMHVSGSIGIQKNNLEKNKNARSQRVIASIQLSQSLFERLSYSLNLSNHSSSLKVVRDELSDSLNLYQITRSASLNTNFLLQPGSSKSILYLSISAQSGRHRDEYKLLDNNSTFFHASTGIRWHNPEKYITLKGGFLYTYHRSMIHDDYVIGPTFKVNRKIFNKLLNFGYSITSSYNTRGGGAAYNLLDNRITADFKIQKAGSFSFSVSHLYKKDNNESKDSYSEIRAILGYKYSF